MARRRPLPLLLSTLAALMALSVALAPATRANDLKPAQPTALLAALDKPAPEGVADLKAIQEQVKQVLEKVIPCTVNIRDGAGQGSGVIVSEEGYVLTAGHVSREANRDVTVTLKDGRRLKAKTCGANHHIDSGLVKIVESKPAGGWPHVEMGKSGELKKGDWVITTGHPGGFQPDRTPVVRLGKVLLATADLIRTDCTIVGGDSGGPLFDMTGRVVGIHSRIAMSLTANIHVPVDTYRATWERLTKGEVWGNGYLGFNPTDPKAKSCRVEDVTKDSPAAKAGLQVDDVVVSFNGKKVGSVDELRQAVADAPVNVEVPMGVERGDELIELKVKLSTRNTMLPGGMEAVRDVIAKNNPKVLSAFRGVADKARQSTVKVLCDGKEAALGTVVGTDGWVLTKCSEVLTKSSELKGKTTCKLGDGRELEATLVGRDVDFDLAMLKVEARGLTAVEWTPSKEAPVGSWLASAGLGQDPVAIGVVSVAVRKGNPKDPRAFIDPATSGFLGVSLDVADGGVKIAQVTPDSGASRAGLKEGDIILLVDGKAVKDVPEVQAAIGAHKFDEKVKLKIKRGSEEKEITATLGKRPPDQARGDIQNNMGEVKLSTRRVGFPNFLQHDTVLKPEQCGGPVVDLDGKVIGINIARAGRTESYAIPSEAVQPLLFDLMSGKLAPKAETTAKALTAEQKVADAKAALQRAEKEKDAAEQKIREAKAALERAEAELKKEKEKDSVKTTK
jgi:serine protease Do